MCLPSLIHHMGSAAKQFMDGTEFKRDMMESLVLTNLKQKQIMVLVAATGAQLGLG